MAETLQSNQSQDSAVEKSLYERRQRIYPRQVRGLFASLRLTGVIVLMGIFYGLPWLQINTGEVVRQAVLWNLPDRKFHIFTLTFWPQDLIYLTALLIVAALSLFFFTAIAGRLWCGYACPQTVWTEVFLWIERKVEGNRSQQIKLANSPWTIEKIMKRSVKHGLWIVLSLWTGLTFVGYFTPIRELFYRFTELQLGAWETFWILFYGFATYGNAGWLREQLCKYMCPYARFQSAMFDRDTLIISYDKERGEPRGARRKSADPASLGLGDCINCTMCVQVCPTGIDIREGLQIECIGCAACIDVCDDVMDKMGYSKGLIRYSTENAMEGLRTRVLRPRVIIYATILVTLLIGSIIGISQRPVMALDVIRDRNVLYRDLGDKIENVFTLKILNKTEISQQYLLDVNSELPLTLFAADPVVNVAAGQVQEVVVRAQIPENNMPADGFGFEFQLQSYRNPDQFVTHESRFVGPRQ
ncbi:MAG: cytochrome c oxidase accessory protein CcoG [Gammaproteobacteria bacterium]|nr:cytochrome c oxidase accessory protein CcoG [Gammaproteobacteria bacterium]MCY4218515.1 cytochrome c oxidase accessory protein CcoG [Gammaproteobacteria bacterium]MCY4276151.1 cytochrome c oxidase accessory protein CcoG [Gammaproteobacteria bacterium]